MKLYTIFIGWKIQFVKTSVLPKQVYIELMKVEKRMFYALLKHRIQIHHLYTSYQIHAFLEYGLMTSIITTPISTPMSRAVHSPHQSPLLSTPVKHWFDIYHYRVVVVVIKLLINGVAQYVLFCVWLLLLSTLFLRCTHVVGYISSSLLFNAW